MQVRYNDIQVVDMFREGVKAGAFKEKFLEEMRQKLKDLTEKWSQDKDRQRLVSHARNISEMLEPGRKRSSEPFMNTASNDREIADMFLDGLDEDFLRDLCRGLCELRKKWSKGISSDRQHLVTHAIDIYRRIVEKKLELRQNYE